MTPAAIKDEAKKAGLLVVARAPDRRRRRQGDRQRRARHAPSRSYMRIHALEATGGLTYSQMPRFATADGKGTYDAALALKDANGQPVATPPRNTWSPRRRSRPRSTRATWPSSSRSSGSSSGSRCCSPGSASAILAVGGTLRNPEPAFKFGFHRKQARWRPARPDRSPVRLPTGRLRAARCAVRPRVCEAAATAGVVTCPGTRHLGKKELNERFYSAVDPRGCLRDGGAGRLPPGRRRHGS